MTPRTVLIVDQGMSFGGSALVATTILEHLAGSRYRVLVVAAVGQEYLRVPAELAPQVFHLAKPYTYLDQEGWRARYRSAPELIRRARGWVDFLGRMIRNSGYLRALLSLIRRERVDLVHLNNGFENLEAHLGAVISRRPVLVHAHGGAGDARLTRRLARRVPMAIAISNVVAESLLQAGVPAHRIATLHNPLTVHPAPLSESERRAVRRRYSVPESAITAAVVGRVVRWKGQLEFLRAFAIAAKGVPSAHALVIGDVADGNEPYRRELEVEIERLNLQQRVQFTGFVQDPREVYSLTDILVHSSIEPEPFGLVLTEAMAYGLPVVAADSGGPLEIITDGVNGFLRSPTDPDAMAGAVRQLLLEPELRARLGAQGKVDVLARFDARRYVTRLAEVYDRTLAAWESGPR